MRCLIVDDEITCRKILQLSLSPFFTIEEAVNGMEALTKINATMQAKSPFDLIILDIMMPIMDGQSVLVAIRATETKHGYPPGHGAKIVMSSALNDAANIKTAFREQVDGYITKPVDLKKMYRLLQEFGHIPGSV